MWKFLVFLALLTTASAESSTNTPVPPVMRNQTPVCNVPEKVDVKIAPQSLVVAASVLAGNDEVVSIRDARRVVEDFKRSVDGINAQYCK